MKKIALVTGASRGIGAEIAYLLSQNNYLVVCVYHQNDKMANQILSRILKNGGDAITYKCDISNNALVKDMIEYVYSCYGRINLLVNNAGISSPKCFTDITEEDWDSTFAVNAKGAYNLCSYVVPRMISSKNGKIINISSVWGIIGASCEVDYSASKAAIIGLTKSLAKELAPSGITVNCIAPGAIKTDMLSTYSSADIIETVHQIPLGRLGTAAEIASAVLYLSEDSADYITGQVLTIDGGFAGV